MNRFSVNLSTIFTEVPFLERFKKAREHGFKYVECQFPYGYAIEELQRELQQNDLTMVLINLPAGNWEKGDRGIAAAPGRLKEFRESVQKGIEYALELNISKLHCLAGVVRSSYPNKASDVYLENIRYAAKEFAQHNLTLLIEPINSFDMTGYFLNDIYQAKEILDAVGLENLKLQFDFYHIERIHGSSLSIYKQFANDIDHIQIADVPDRGEPGTGSMDYQRIFLYLDNSYEGFIGLEYNPSTNSKDSFAWLRK